MVLLRSAAFNLFYFLSTLVMALTLGLPVWLFAPRRALALGMFWARLELTAARLICGIRVQVSGRENLPASGAALIASRHESAFDTMVWLTLLPKVSYVLKRELTRVPIFGNLLRPAGMIPVDRDGGASALRALVTEGARAAGEGRQIVIFPEGTRGEHGAMLPLHPGVAALAAATSLPVIPVVTDSGLLWGRRAFHKYPGTISIRILPPLPTGLRRPALMAQLDAALRHGHDKLAPDRVA